MYYLVSSSNLENMAPIGPYNSASEAESDKKKIYAEGLTHEDPCAELFVEFIEK